ncbi:MAG: phospholipase D family protein [Gammaproteobacteria bacterium]
MELPYPGSPGGGSHVHSITRLVLLAITLVNGPAGAAGLGESVARLSAGHPGQSGLLLLDTGGQALHYRDALISAAARSIDAQYYIWNSDDSGRYLAARLLAAADRGVQVRVLLDDMNVAGRDAVFAALAAHPNVQIRIYNPSAARSGFLQLLSFIADFSRTNRRMHNKSFTVDGAVSIVGGRNVGDEYFDLDPEENFRDRELLVAGPVVAPVTECFEAFWTSPWSRAVASLAAPDGPIDAPALLAATTAALAAQGYMAPATLANDVGPEALAGLLWAPARLVYDPPPTREQISDSGEQQRVARELRSLIATARQDILVESAYFILGDQSLAEAARLHAAGVRLRVLTNSLASNDLVTNHSGYARRRPAMLDAGIELYELRPDAAACRRLITLSRACDHGPAFSLHAKSLVLDRRVVYIGSFNLNLRSAYLNSETALIVSSPELALQLSASVDELLQPDSSWRVTRAPAGGLLWTTAVDGRTVQESREPMTSTWRRFTSRVYRLFPLEKYL